VYDWEDREVFGGKLSGKEHPIICRKTKGVDKLLHRIERNCRNVLYAYWVMDFSYLPCGRQMALHPSACTQYVMT